MNSYYDEWNRYMKKILKYIDYKDVNFGEYAFSFNGANFRVQLRNHYNRKVSLRGNFFLIEQWENVLSIDLKSKSFNIINKTYHVGREFSLYTQKSCDVLFDILWINDDIILKIFNIIHFGK